MIALAGHALAEHDSPGEATLHVLHGRVRLSAGSAVLLTVAKNSHRSHATAGPDLG